MPLNINDDDYVFSDKNVRKINKCDIHRLRQASAIFIDEVSMVCGVQLKYIDRAFSFVLRDRRPFGGKLIVLGGDFRQCLPIIKGATTEQLIQSTILCSRYFIHGYQVKKFTLNENMRANSDERDFAAFLLQIGNGVIRGRNDEELSLDGRMDNDRFVTVSEYMISTNNENNFLDEIFGLEYIRSVSKNNVALLCPTNKLVNEMNDRVIDRYYRNTEIFYSEDTLYFETDNVEGVDQLGITPEVRKYEQKYSNKYFTPDLLNTFNPTGYPLHALKIAKGCILMCLRNLDIKEGLCNGTRMVYIKTINEEGSTKKLFKCRSLDGAKTFLIAKVEHTPVNLKMAIPFTRNQFPVKIGYCMTINMFQGQTLDRVGLYLNELGIFSHGQLYVALSRAKSASSLKIKWSYPQNESRQGKIRNVINHSIIYMATNNIPQISLTQDMMDVYAGNRPLENVN
uniref:ATP-dependent DNA helicase n=1 Tax=Parastrongyloides trichosuri TaxID=131310 RepID=A0A0N4ZGE7_PARTI